MDVSLGVVGLGTMGANLARNAAKRKAAVAVFNRTKEKTDVFMTQHAAEGTFTACATYDELIAALKPPRAILIMVSAGKAVDDVIDELTPKLSPGDIVIDGGNSHYSDTERRCSSMAERGFRFLGLGVSGGELGALNGPSLMPGGDASAYKHVEPLLRAMAAPDGTGDACVEYLGPGGAGHFVKMVHNGIEYALMQIIAECYDVLRSLAEFSSDQIAETFQSWSSAHDLSSYLLEVSAAVLRKKEGSRFLIDLIKDVAEQKGTGKWTTIAALEYGVAIPTITAGVDARILSGASALRKAGKDFPVTLDLTEPMPKADKLRSFVRASYDLSAVCAYHQGFELIAAASEHHGWKIPVSSCARLWRAGCIIRSAQLPLWQAAYSTEEVTRSGAWRAILGKFMAGTETDWRLLPQLTASRGLPTFAISASLNYFDTLHREKLPQNLIQAQRDYFGAHTFERTDKTGTFHADWAK